MSNRETRKFKKRWAGRLFLLLMVSGCLPSWGLAQSDVQYQLRSQDQSGTWREGIKPKPVSGGTMELISVLADYEEPVPEETFPDMLKLRFYLDETREVFVIVRELDYRTYYWLDKVQPVRPWAKGFQNIFVWPTDPVLQRVTPRLTLYDLGGLVRLDDDTTSSIERVAPGVLYHDAPPARITGYVFTLKPGEDVRLSAVMTEEATGTIVDQQLFRRKRGGRPFTIHWDARESASGPYVLAISGFSLSTNQPISKEIHFFHQPGLNP